MTRRQVAADETETGSIEHERDGSSTFVAFTPCNKRHATIYIIIIQASVECKM